MKRPLKEVERLQEEVQALKSDIMLLIEEMDRVNQKIINMNHKFETKINLKKAQKSEKSS